MTTSSARRAWLPAFSTAIVLAAAGCSTRITTKHVATPAPAVLEDEGIHYYLPRTIVRVSIPVTETATRAGAYADLAPLFFPFANPKNILPTAAGYSIDPTTVTFVSRGVRDPGQHYVVKPTGYWWANTIFKFALSSDGVVNKLDITFENRSVDLTLTAIETAAGIAAKVASTSAAALVEAQPRTGALVLPTACPYYGGERADMNKGQRAMYDTLVSRYRPLYCHLFPEDRDAVFGGVSLDILLRYLGPTLEADLKRDSEWLRKDPALSKVQKFISARALIQELDALRSANAELLNRWPANASVDVVKVIQDARTTRMKEILGQFFGTKSTDPAYAVAIFDVDAGNPAEGKAVELFKLSEDGGICAVDAAQLGAAVPVADCSKATKPIEAVTATVTNNSAPINTDDSASKGTASAAPSGESGIRYRIPGQGTLVLKQAATELGRSVMDVAQFGAIASLPKRTGGLKTQYTVELDPATGALRDITVGNAGMLTNEAITRSGKAAESAIDTRRALTAPPPAGPSAQEQAEKERKLKEEQLRIRLLDECLQDPTKAGCADLITPE